MNSPESLGCESHEIKFVLTEMDAWALLKAVDNAFPGTPGHPAPRWLKLVLTLLKWSIITLPVWLFCVVIIVMGTAGTAIKMWQVFVVAALSFIIGISGALALPERKLHPFVRGYLGLDRERTMILSVDGVRALDGEGVGFTPWKAYREVEVSNGFVLLYRKGGAEFIPTSAFSGDEQADEITRFAAARIRDTHVAPGDPTQRDDT